MDAEAIPAGATALVASTVHHRLKTVVLHDDLIGWVQAGTKTVRQATGHWTWRQGELFLLPRGTEWDVENDPAPDGHYRALVLVPGRDALQALGAGVGQARPVRHSARVAVDAELGDTLQRAARAFDAVAPLSAPLQRHRLHEVLLMLAERGWWFEPGDPPAWSDRVRRRIAQHPERNWSMEALAAAFAVSASTLRRRLAHDGHTASGLVRDVRLETALGLLHGTALPVGDVAARCGYHSHSRFSAAFRARFGLSPSDLRPRTAG